VKPNDTPQSIALDYAISVDELYRYNPDLKNRKAIDNQKIVIPKTTSKNFRFVKYRVNIKETLYSISRHYNVSIEDLKAFNPQLYENELKAGEVINIPAYKLPDEFQNVDFNESIKNSNFSAFKHFVLPNERKADIIDKYGISSKAFDSLNEGIIEVQSGQLVKIIKTENEKDDFDLASLDMNLQFYEVPRQQTMYSLSKEFKISEDIIYKLNPIVRREGLKAGTIIKLPEQISSLNEAEKIVDLESRIQNFNEKKLALFLPFNLDQFEKDSINAKQILLRDNLLNISLDFYDGVKLAIKKARSKGIYTDLKVYDTKRNPMVMDSLLMQNSFVNQDAIIGPISNKNIKKLSDELKNSEVPVFLPFPYIEDSPSYVFSTVPQQNLQTETLITHIDSSLTEQKKLLFITDSTALDKYEMYKYSFPNATFYQTNKSYVDTKELEPLLDKEKENWVVLETNQMGISQDVVMSLFKYNKGFFKEELTKDKDGNDIKVDLKPEDKTQFDIRLFTSERNKAYGDKVIENKDLSKLEFTYVSTSKYDVLESNPLIEDYIRKNGHVPNRYVLRAFDLTYDILLRLAYEGNLKNDEALNPLTEYNENRFGYQKQFMTENYENKGLYIIQYKPNFEVSIINADRN
jgi:LysM repeat protein